MLKRNICSFVGTLTIAALVYGAVPVSCVYAENARVALNNAPARARNTGDAAAVRETSARAATSRNGTVRANSRGTSVRSEPSVEPVARSASPARSGVAPANVARTGTSNTASRALTQSRATAVFNDISKIGSGYAACRESYATCMDQFCANANDTYRRCFCSSRFTEFRDTEAALDEAKTLLMQFEDNNLNAVDKTAAEVNAMYSATVGEMAIKKDTSGAAQILDQIGDLLSGKTKASTLTSGSLGVLSFDISSDVDDIWSGTADSIFNTGSGQNLADLEGEKLYNAANKQCLEIISDACENNAVLQMSRSSYNIMITQDCNAYAKKIDSQKEAVKQTVRTAEKYLREARLDEYRAHNSTDVNECIAKVKTAITADTACGTNYTRCMDYTGVYINQTTGEPIYSQRLFELDDLITLAGANSNEDVLRQNQQFDKFLDTKRMYAETALDSCRNIADTVWSEFKRSALIEIAQAQDEKIEEVKMSCVNTMAECYDTQSSALKDFDTSTSKAAGAVSVYAAREMCADKVIACASLYGDTKACKFDGNGKLISGNNGRCGLESLLTFVDSVDTNRIGEACGVAVQKYLENLCTDENGYPWRCRLRKFGTMNIAGAGSGNDKIWTYGNSNNASLVQMVVNYTYENCGQKDASGNYALNLRARSEVELALADLQESLASIIGEKCEAANGIWVDTDVNNTNNALTNGELVESFYNINFGKSHVAAQADYGVDSWGKCLSNTVRARCEAENLRTGSADYAVYDNASGTCRFTLNYYKYQCDQVAGVWENNNCYLEK